ncbi:F-box-like protein, partial [Trifolium medium]|nr:F-box-like protein [Trifolium medium]
MALGSEDGNDAVSATTGQQLTISTITLTSPPPQPTLPLDVVAEILYKLPVKVLFQLHCV